MMEFAVRVKGLDTADKARWVLAVDPAQERFLIAHDDQSLHWVPMADCTFARVASPDVPRLVRAVQPPPQREELVRPHLTAMRGGER